MGMRSRLEQITPAQLDRFIKNPRLAYKHIHRGHTVAGPGKSTKLRIITTSNESKKELSLEKEWQLVHYILNGTLEEGTGPLAEVVLGGVEIPDLDGEAGYGPLRYLSPEKVKAVASALAEVDPDKLAEAFDPKDAASKGVYGSGIPESMLSFIQQQLPPERAQLVLDRLATAPKLGRLSAEDVANLINPVRTFYQEAARDGNAMLLYVS